MEFGSQIVWKYTVSIKHETKPIFTTENVMERIYCRQINVESQKEKYKK